MDLLAIGGERFGVPVLAALLLTNCSSAVGRPRLDAASDQAEVADSYVQDASVKDVPTLPPVGACAAAVTGCNPVSRAGCATGEGCIPTASTLVEFRCAVVERRTWDIECASDIACAAGFICHPSLHRCVAPCCPGDDRTCQNLTSTPRRGSVCRESLTSGIGYCVESGCDPFSPDDPTCGEHAPYYCQYASVGAPYCLAFTRNPPSGAGEPCSRWTDCQRGYVCEGGTCRKLCRLAPITANDRCVAPTQCRAELTGAAEGIGICR